MTRRSNSLYAFFLLLPLTAFADPVVDTRHVYYMVQGDTAMELWADIERKTPVQQDGRWHVGFTKWNVNWRFWWREQADSCAITRVTTTLDVVYTMPRLTQTDSAPDELLRQWQTFYAALYDHERGHRDIGLRAATEIEDAIAAMKAEVTCSQLERAANKTARDLIKKFARIEKDYDRTTNHGLNTGAVFPVVNASK